MQRDILRLRRWCIRRYKEGMHVTEICTLAKIPRRTFYNWLFKYRRYHSLEDRSRNPHTTHKTDRAIASEIIKTRKENGWSPVKIEGYLRQKGITASHATVYKIICKAGLNNPIGYVRKTWGKTRFQRNAPNQLWQADFKLLDDDSWMLTFLDDCSRFITVCKEQIDATAENAILLFEKAGRIFGFPLQVLTDQGVQFHDTNGMSEFKQFCLDNNIQHIVASKRRPTTIGKVERFHRTYEEERHRFATLRKYLHYYNYVRPHQSLNYLTPAEVYLIK